MYCVKVMSQKILQLIIWRKNRDFVFKKYEKGVDKCFYVDFNPIDTNNIIDIHKYLMERT